MYSNLGADSYYILYAGTGDSQNTSPAIELLDNDGSFLQDNDGVQLIDNI